MGEEKEISVNEKRVRNLTQLYYSRKEIQKAIFDFCSSRETVPRYFEGFGRRPDMLQFPSDVLELAKKGATSFHCSEELWCDSLKVETGMNEKQLNELRKGWDLLIDIDSKYLDYSKISAKIIIEFLKFHGIKNIGVKFSGSKGFHLIVPWKAFPPEINGVQTKNMFPEWPRIISKYIIEQTKNKLVKEISELERPNKYVKDFTVSEKVMPDIILVSPRHLFRTPYSLHEKTSLASVVLSSENIVDFKISDADPMKISNNPKKFMPDSIEGEATELLIQALDWSKENIKEEKVYTEKEFAPIKILNLSEKNFPPSIQKILLGLSDGRKRGLFVLIGFFRGVGMEKTEIEKRIFEWNEKNEVPLKQGYIITQIIWSYKNKLIPPPNFDKDYYKGIGIIPTPEEIRYKNPINYVARKTFGDSEGKNTRKKYSKRDKD